MSIQVCVADADFARTLHRIFSRRKRISVKEMESKLDTQEKRDTLSQLLEHPQHIKEENGFYSLTSEGRGFAIGLTDIR